MRHFSSHREPAVCWEPAVGHKSVGDSRGGGAGGGGGHGYLGHSDGWEPVAV